MIAAAPAREVTCYGQIRTRVSVQEWYETSTGDARRRASQLRKAGYLVYVESMGSQVTSVGRVAMTLLTVDANNTSEMLDRLPAVNVVRV